MTWQELERHLILREAIEHAAIERISRKTGAAHFDWLYLMAKNIAAQSIEYRTSWWLAYRYAPQGSLIKENYYVC